MKFIVAAAVLCLIGLGLGLYLRLRSGASEEPKYLMLKVAWSFWQPKSDDYESFVDAVTVYNENLPGEHEWSPGKIVSGKPMRVLLEPLWLGPEDNVDLAVGEPGKPVTMGLLLFTLHRELHALFADADHHFFEGLERVDSCTYRIMTGS